MKIKNIRSKDTSPGLTVYESSLSRLFDKITIGSQIQVSETGTTLTYILGVLVAKIMIRQYALIIILNHWHHNFY